MADFLDVKKREITERLKELKPLVEEYHRLEAAQRALEGVRDTGSATKRRGPGRPRGSATKRRRSAGAGAGKRGRPKGSGTRGKQALKFVTSNPGITIPELAEKMGIKQNYLYRVMPSLEQDEIAHGHDVAAADFLERRP